MALHIEVAAKARLRVLKQFFKRFLARVVRRVAGSVIQIVSYENPPKILALPSILVLRRFVSNSDGDLSRLNVFPMDNCLAQDLGERRPSCLYLVSTRGITVTEVARPSLLLYQQ